MAHPVINFPKGKKAPWLQYLSQKKLLGKDAAARDLQIDWYRLNWRRFWRQALV